VKSGGGRSQPTTKNKKSIKAGKPQRKKWLSVDAGAGRGSARTDNFPAPGSFNMPTEAGKLCERAQLLAGEKIQCRVELSDRSDNLRSGPAEKIQAATVSVRRA
jgi:hypothetical protein